tara:strand:- start:815 stop:1450 length:636 start_codon:yes stop_codon:yes gene_type:complete
MMLKGFTLPQNKTSAGHRIPSIHIAAQDDKLRRFFQAAQDGKIRDFKALLPDQNINSRDTDNNTALHWATQNAKINIAQFLINQGAELNFQNIRHNTVLHLAVLNNNLGIVQLLLKSNAALTIKNESQRTPFEIAFIKLESYLNSQRPYDETIFDSQPVKNYLDIIIAFTGNPIAMRRYNEKAYWIIKEHQHDPKTLFRNLSQLFSPFLPT